MEDYFVKAYGADHFARISKALTRPSCYSCIRVNTLKSTADAVVRKLTSILDEEKLSNNLDSVDANIHSAADDQVVSQESSNGSISLGQNGTPKIGEYPLERLERLSIVKCQIPGLEYVVFVKGSGPHMFRYGNQPDEPMKEVLVSRKCAEAVLRGAQIYVPGVLACSAHVEKGDIVAVSVAVEQPDSDNGWVVGITRGTTLQGSQSDPHYVERNGLYIGQGVALMSRAGIFRALKGTAVEMTNRVYKLPSFHDVLEGDIFLQNLPSIVTAHALDPQQGERILDLCAAPGGKTTAIAIIMRDKGEIVATDRSHNKVMDILKLAAEMGLTCIKAYRLDALKSVRRTTETLIRGSTTENRKASDVADENSESVGVKDCDLVIHNIQQCSTDVASMQNDGNGKADQGRYLSKAKLRKEVRQMRNGPGRNHCIVPKAERSNGFLPDTFDRVLLDAPCSALGLRPRLFAMEETMDSLKHHANYQRKMFDQAIQLVRPGGVIVYSTCTINPGENEALVRYALDKYKFLSLASQNPRIGGPGLVGRCELFDGEYVEEWLTQDEAELVQRFDPSSSLDTIGFFIAKFNVGKKDN